MNKGNWTNTQIAQLLREVSAALEIKNASRFKIIAYDRAATSVEHLTAEIKDYWDEGKLNQIPGIGASISQHLDELFKTGQSRHFRQLTKDLPPAMFELIRISGIGPKTAYKLCQELKIWRADKAREKVVEAAKRGKIRKIPGFGEKSEKNLLLTLEKQELKKKEKTRILLPVADAQAEAVADYLRLSSTVLEVQPLGSIRRRCATVGDIELAAKTNKPKGAVAHFVGYPKTAKIINQGEKKSSILLTNGLQIDFRTQSPRAWGSMLQYFTGSKYHNIHLRRIALTQNLSLSEHGIRDLKTQKVTPTPTEKKFYQRLKMSWIPPEMREDQGEIEMALKGKIPRLVKTEDIKGDLQLHSSFPVEPSHDLGENDFKTMIEKAQALNYQYLGFTEHNPALSNHTDKQIITILSRKKEEIDKLNSRRTNNLNIKVFNGLEIDIRPDGKLALPNKGFALLDYAVASIHSRFDMEKQAMTKRILAGLAHPKVKILAHPTGRILNYREAYEADWGKIFAFCQKNDKAVEVNAFPKRTDLPDFLIREAIGKNVRLVINTDSHSVDQMDYMSYGVAAARRGWAKKKDVANTLPVKLMLKWLTS